MKKLVDILKEAGIQTGKVYTDKDRTPFKLNEFKSFNDRFRNMDTIKIKDKREHQRIMKYLDKKGWSYMDIGYGNGEWHIQFDNTKEAMIIRRELEKKRFKIIDPNNESVKEAKDDLLYVQGIGRYDYKGLKRNVEKKIKDLTRRNKKGDHSGLGKNQFSVLAAMWEALSEYEEENE